MTLTAPPAPPDASPGGPGARPRPSRSRRASRAIWAFLVSRHTAVGVLLALAGLSLAGTLIDQSPSAVRDDPSSYGGWLDSVRPRYGVLTDRMYALGLFHVFASVWFQIAAGLLVATILASTAQRLPGLWRRAARAHVDVDQRLLDHAPSRETIPSSLAAEEAVARVSTALRGRRFRVAAAATQRHTTIYADRFRLQPLASAVSHAAVVLVVVGIVVSASAGFRDPEFAVTVGEERAIGHGTGLAIRAVGFTDSYDAAGRPTDYSSAVELVADGRVVRRATLRVNHPLRAEGIAIYQSYFGNAAVLTVQPPGGASSQVGVPLQWADDTRGRMVGRWEAPGTGLTVVVQGPGSGRSDPALLAGEVRVDVLAEGDRPIAGATLAPGQTLTADGWRLTFERERPFTGLTVSRDPGARWVWLGSGLMLAGLLGSLIVRHRRLWVRVRSGPTGCSLEVVSPDRRDGLVSPWFDRVTDQVRTAVSSSDPPSGEGA